MKKYGIINNLKYILCNLWQQDRKTVIFALMQMPVLLLLPLVEAFTPSIIIYFLEENSTKSSLMIVIFAITSFLCLLKYTKTYLANQIDVRSRLNQLYYVKKVNIKEMSIGLEVLETPDGRNKSQKAYSALYRSHGLRNIINTMSNIIINFFGFLSYFLILFSFNKWIIPLLICSYVLDMGFLALARNIDHKTKDKRIYAYRKIHYLINLALDFNAAKDIRVYHLIDWFKEIGSVFIKEQKKLETDVANKKNFFNFTALMFSLLRTCALYYLIVNMSSNEHITISNIVLCLSASLGFITWIEDIIQSIDALGIASNLFCDIRDFLDLDDCNKFRGISSFKKSNTYAVEIEDLSYKYPGCDNYTLEHINIQIKEGEKVALVGLNGAGKTTLVKLLCGLYTPTSGKIKISGINAFDFNKDEYFSLFSVLFQDLKFLPVSIAENISMCSINQTDMSMVKYCLIKVGLWEKVSTLKDGVNTKLIKNIDEDSTELSGGELQKLLLSRAIYKNGYINVLDEPTASLDPLAENEIYNEFNEITRNKTSIFISHRLASTQFCDRIILLDNKKIVEEGTHEELINRNGKYAEMFRVQKQYYED